MKKESKINLKKQGSKLKQFFKDYDWNVKAKLITFAVVVVLIIIDQVVKHVISTNFERDVEYSFLPGFINIRFVINYGSAFGFNQNKTVLLITIAFLMAFALLIWWIFNRSTSLAVGISFIFAGTIGNLTDRFRFNGGVVDFLKWDMFNPKTIFNSADMMVTIGIIIIVVYFVVEGILSIVSDRKEKKAQKKANEK